VNSIDTLQAWISAEHARRDALVTWAEVEKRARELGIDLPPHELHRELIEARRRRTLPPDAGAQ
jgi:hypothetical protein